MRKYLIITLLCSMPALGQMLFVSPSSITVYGRAMGAYPYEKSAYPRKALLSVSTDTSTMGWTISYGGQLTTICTNGSGTQCAYLTGEFDGLKVTTTQTATTTPTVYALNWNGYGEYPVAGTYTGTVTLTPTTGEPVSVSVTLIVVAKTNPTTEQATAPTGAAPVGCSNAVPLAYDYAETCPVPDQRPGGAFDPPAVGSSYVDDTFHGTVKRITPSGCDTQYGTTSAFSALNTYLWVACANGTRIYRISDVAQICDAPTCKGDSSYMWMSKIDDQSYYYMIGTTIHRYNFVTATDTNLGDFASYGFSTLFAGGTAQASTDDWVAIYDYNWTTHTKVCAVNLRQLITDGSPGVTNTFCGSYDALSAPLTNIDWAQTSGLDATGKRSVMLMSNPFIVVYSVTVGGTLTHDFDFSEWPGRDVNNDNLACQVPQGESCNRDATLAHSSMYRGRDGAIRMFSHFEEVTGGSTYISTHKLSSGISTFRPVEEPNGGMTIHTPLVWDTQPGCSDAIGGCGIAGFDGSGRVAVGISSVTKQNPCFLTTSPAHTFSAGTRSVRIENAVVGFTGLNALWTATIVNSTQLSIPTNCSGYSGTYTANSATLGDAVMTSSDPWNATTNRSVIMVLIPGVELRRIAQHRSIGWTNPSDISAAVPGTGITYYGTTTKANLSRDGSMVAFSSNYGKLEPNSVYIAWTGFNRILITFSGKITLSGKAQ